VFDAATSFYDALDAADTWPRSRMNYRLLISFKSMMKRPEGATSQSPGSPVAGAPWVANI